MYPNSRVKNNGAALDVVEQSELDALEAEVRALPLPSLTMYQVCINEPFKQFEFLFINGNETNSFIDKKVPLSFTKGQLVHFNIAWSGYRKTVGRSKTKVDCNFKTIGTQYTYFSSTYKHQQSSMSCIWNVQEDTDELHLVLQSSDPDSGTNYITDGNDSCVITMLTLG